MASSLPVLLTLTARPLCVLKVRLNPLPIVREGDTSHEKIAATRVRSGFVGEIEGVVQAAGSAVSALLFCGLLALWPTHVLRRWRRAQHCPYSVLKGAGNRR